MTEAKLRIPDQSKKAVRDWVANGSRYSKVPTRTEKKVKMERADDASIESGDDETENYDNKTDEGKTDEELLVPEGKPQGEQPEQSKKTAIASEDGTKTKEGKEDDEDDENKTNEPEKKEKAKKNNPKTTIKTTGKNAVAPPTTGQKRQHALVSEGEAVDTSERTKKAAKGAAKAAAKVAAGLPPVPKKSDRKEKSDRKGGSKLPRSPRGRASSKLHFDNNSFEDFQEAAQNIKGYTKNWASIAGVEFGNPDAIMIDGNSDIAGMAIFCDVLDDMFTKKYVFEANPARIAQLLRDHKLVPTMDPHRPNRRIPKYIASAYLMVDEISDQERSEGTFVRDEKNGKYYSKKRYYGKWSRAEDHPKQLVVEMDDKLSTADKFVVDFKMPQNAVDGKFKRICLHLGIRGLTRC